MNTSDEEATPFFQRARYEANRYGSDDWVFLRELVQNSRDAGASNIQFTFQQGSGQEILVCLDNGTGMSKKDLERYLLNLYSSSKEPLGATVGEKPEHLGFFGVGFWSVLRFNPVSIEVVSKKNGTVCAVGITPEKGSVHEIHREWVGPYVQGTQIRLTRKNKGNNLASSHVIREKLLHYAKYIQPLMTHTPKKDTTKNQICLTFNGNKINEDFCGKPALKQVCKPTYEFLINVTKQASFHLYHCGLLIHACSSMDELFLKRTSAPLIFNPEIRLNLQHAIPLMDRKTIYEEPTITKVMEIVDKTCKDIQEQMIKSSFPLGIRGHWKKFKQNKLKKVALYAILGSVLLLAAWALLRTPDIPRPKQPHVRDLTSIELAAPNATSTQERPNSWSFQYKRRRSNLAQSESSGDTAWDAPSHDLTLFSLGTLNPMTLSSNPKKSWPGLSKLTPIVDHKELLFLDLTMSIRRTRPSDSPFQLPCPAGYFLLNKAAVQLNGSRFTEIKWDEKGTAFAQFKESGELRYSLQKSGLASESTETGNSDFSGISLPPEMMEFADEHMHETVSMQVKALRSFIKSNFNYRLASSFGHPAANSVEHSTWRQNLIQKGGGDCDELNGLGTQILTYWEIPATLHYGLVGKQGYAAPDLHAWITYDRGMNRILDLTVPIQDPGNTLAVEADAMNKNESTKRTLRKTGATNNRKPEILLWHFTAVASGSGFILVLFLVLWNRKRAMPDSDFIPPSQMAEMLKFQMDHGSEDRLSLLYRPFFSTISGKSLCLNDFHRMNPNKFILVKSGPNAMNIRKDSTLLIIDKANPVFSALSPYLPEFFDLELAEAPPNPFPYLTRFFHRIAPDWKLFIQLGKKGFRYYRLPLASEGLGEKQIVLGALSIPMEILDQSASRRQIYAFFQHLLKLTKEG